jgi:alkylhydroperoxidase family enzyme
MGRRLDAMLRAVESAVLEGRGVLDRSVRRAAYDGEATGEAASRWVGKVHHRAHTVTDEDLAELRKAGLDDDAVFELTVAAALGAGARRLRLALAAMNAAPPQREPPQPQPRAPIREGE